MRNLYSEKGHEGVYLLGNNVVSAGDDDQQRRRMLNVAFSYFFYGGGGEEIVLENRIKWDLNEKKTWSR